MTNNKIMTGALGLILVGATLSFSGCSRGEKTLAGAVIGAGAGAGIGAAIGGGTGAAIGAGTGAVVGGAVGYSRGNDKKNGEGEKPMHEKPMHEKKMHEKKMHEKRMDHMDHNK